jgi:magnesium transporter
MGLIKRRMARFIKKQKQDIGRSPDELWFRGEKKIDEVLLRVIDYNAEDMKEDTLSKVSEIKKYQNSGSVTWFNIDGLHNTALMEEIADVFEFDNLILADVMNTTARPKMEEFDNCILISIKMLKMDEASELISVENLSLIMTEDVLITFQEKKGDVFEPVRDRIRKQKKRIRHAGTDYLAFALLDIVIDNYIYILSVLGEKIENLEEHLLQISNKSIIDEINAYKRELNFLRKNIKPAKEMIISLSKMESELIDDSCYVHYKELVDNISQASDSSDSYREILSDQLNIYHSTVSTKLNDIMKFLTIFSVIFIPLTFIAGIYGTNFDFVPELHYEYSYFIMWGIMLVVALSMLFYFRKRKWF